MDTKTREELSYLKKNLAMAREAISHPGELIKESIDHPCKIDLWKLSDRELDQEMANRLSSLNESIDTRPRDRITSHRRWLGPVVVWIKRLIRFFFSPYTNLLFARQTRFNEDLVAFHLASFIRLRLLEKRLVDIEEKLADLKEELPIPEKEPKEGIYP